MRALLGAPSLRDRERYFAKPLTETPAQPALPLPFGRDDRQGILLTTTEHAVRACSPCRVFPAPVWQWCKSQLPRLVSERSQVRLLPRTDKKETFERLIRERKLGYFALIRNLRNMEHAGVDAEVVREAILSRKGGADRIQPFRYIAAARHAKRFEPELDTAMQAALLELPKLSGTTIVLVDNSGSMAARLSRRSDMTRSDAAAGVAIVARGVCESVRVFAFSEDCVEVPPRTGMALRDAIHTATRMGSTQLGAAVAKVSALEHDRLIVITDEQSADRVPEPKGLCYMINVASNRNGVGHGKWLHVDGWSDAVVRFITEHERTDGASE